MSNLQGKVALVTGASKGIGAGIARELARRGAAVAVNYSSSKAEAEKLVAEINATGGRAIAVQGNVADSDAIGPFVQKVARELGPIDILVNNAGIYTPGPIEAVTPEHFHKQFGVNVLGLLLTTQAALQHFSPTGGSIVNISSVVVDGVPGLSVYSATKGAVDSITASLAKELGPRKIRVNSPQPGHGGNRRHPRRRLHRQRLREGSRRPHAARPHWPAPGHRHRRRLSRLRRLLLDQRAGDPRRRRLQTVRQGAREQRNERRKHKGRRDPSHAAA